jgi:mRNA degradation ribonuclease J1/J2
LIAQALLTKDAHFRCCLHPTAVAHLYSLIDGVIVTHCHADHDAGAFQKILFEGQVTVITTPTIYGSFIRKYSALSGLPPALLRQTHRFLPATIGETLRVRGASLNFFYTLHSIPCIGLEVREYVERSCCCDI